MSVGPVESAAAYIPAGVFRAPDEPSRTHEQKVPPVADVKRSEMRVEAGPGLGWVYTLVDASTGAELWRWPTESYAKPPADPQVDSSAAGKILDLAA
jgi:hypothetical protein